MFNVSNNAAQVEKFYLEVNTIDIYITNNLPILQIKMTAKDSYSRLQIVGIYSFIIVLVVVARYQLPWYSGIMPGMCQLDLVLVCSFTMLLDQYMFH